MDQCDSSKIGQKSAKTKLWGISFLPQVKKFQHRIKRDSKELDIEKTIVDTLAKGGLFVSHYKKRKVAPEYLALIDQASSFDHQNRRR